jgi:thiol-disulfide isomerase/thioredoxin
MFRLPSLLVALLLAAPAAADGPFVDLDYDAATAKAKEAGKLLMLDFTASWCPPCKMLEKQTWPDEKVIDWVAAHAIAIQVDVDVAGNKELAQKFGVRSIPTLVFLRDGTELDRYTGFKSPADFVTWGNEVATGKATPGARAAAAADAATSDDPDRRRDLAQQLAEEGKPDEALEHFLWVWHATRDVPRWMGVRHSYLLSEIAELAESHPPAKKALNDLLEAAQRNIEAVETITWLDWIEWESLCEKTGQDARLLAWYDAHRSADGTVQTDRLDAAVAPRVRQDVFDQLVASRRFVDAAHAMGDPVALAQSRIEANAAVHKAIAGQEDGPMKEMLQANFAQRLQEEVAPLYGCAYAAGQAEAAHKVSRFAIAAMDTPGMRIALVRAALDMSDTQDPQLTTLLDEAAALDADPELDVEEARLRAELQKRASAPAPAAAGG